MGEYEKESNFGLFAWKIVCTKTICFCERQCQIEGFGTTGTRVGHIFHPGYHQIQLSFNERWPSSVGITPKLLQICFFNTKKRVLLLPCNISPKYSERNISSQAQKPRRKIFSEDLEIFRIEKINKN